VWTGYPGHALLANDVVHMDREYHTLNFNRTWLVMTRWDEAMYDGPEELSRLCRGNVMPDLERTLR
jgi:hypothetical protein